MNQQYIFTRSSFLERGLMSHASQGLRVIWMIPLIISFNFCLALKQSGSWTR